VVLHYCFSPFVVMSSLRHEPLAAMRAINLVRAAISFFILIVMGLAVTGWIWTGMHQAPSQARASHVVLALVVLAGLIGLRSLWWRAEGRRT
jgi:hypothetical protein